MTKFDLEKDVQNEELKSYIIAYHESTGTEFEIFLRDTYGENMLQVVLRSHLYIENTLEKIIEDALENPKLVLGDRSPFAFKLSLVRALGVIPPEYNKLLKHFNKEIRNKYAHDLKFELNENHIEDLIDLFDKRTKELYESYIDGVSAIIEDQPELLKKLIVSMSAMWISIQKYHLEYLLKPLQEESDLLEEMDKLIDKNKDNQKTYMDKRKSELVQKFKQVVLG